MSKLLQTLLVKCMQRFFCIGPHDQVTKQTHNRVCMLSASLLLLAEAVLCGLIIWKIRYTEIDWVAYMQEVEGYLSGERDYSKLRGDTGPLVYPALFLYVYSGIRWLTDEGRNILAGQCIFAVVYVVNLAVVLALYSVCSWSIIGGGASDGDGQEGNMGTSIDSSSVSAATGVRRSTRTNAKSDAQAAESSPFTSATTARSADNGAIRRVGSFLTAEAGGVPLWAWGLLALSKRVHSIFVLRMFNDTLAALCGYIAVLLFTQQRWRSGCWVYSLGVGMKMNLLLYAPGVLLVLLLGNGVTETCICLSICAGTQAVLGAPFLVTYPQEYLAKAFEMSRVFTYKWTVNFKFLDEQVFLSKRLSLALLAMTLLGMVALWRKFLLENAARLQQRKSKRDRACVTVGGLLWNGVGSVGPLTPQFIAVTIFTSNFIGIAFARTIHYQFYSWYFHSLPLLLWHCRMPSWMCVLIMGAIEAAYNVYPATAWSSLLLQTCHMGLLVGLLRAPAPLAVADLTITDYDANR